MALSNNGRKNTVVGVHRHVMEEEEIQRIIRDYKAHLGIDITKLEASAIIAQRSTDVLWNPSKARAAIAKLRGL